MSDFHSIVCHVREHGKKVYVDPWPERVAVARTLFMPGMAQPVRLSVTKDDEGERLQINADNGTAVYREVRDPAGPDDITWYGKLVYGSHQPAPPERDAGAT